MSHPQNELSQAASPYLRAASQQPVQWLVWSPEAFARALREDKAIFLSVGAHWCHWCHVMDAESYSNEGTAALINELFIPIRVDRDERPDLDVRLQSAIAAISGQGGWPLTAFLTPDGLPFFGGGYFPPEDRYGRPSLERVCVMMHEAFTKRREEVVETAHSVLAAVEGNDRFADAREALTPALATNIVSKLVSGTLAQFDARNGGFGQQPKFPNAPALELLLSADPADPLAAQATEAVRTTLAKMAQGGIHDHLGGGFHRYSTDEHWLVPRFEKTLYDNAALLSVYAHAYASLGDAVFAQAAHGILRFLTETLSDEGSGGFYSSQAADVSFENNGDFFTWTRAEAQAVLTPDEFAAAASHFNLRAVGDMRHNPAKNVLHLSPSAAASSLPLESAITKLRAARNERPVPPVDRTLYTGWNSLTISAFLAAAAALHDAAAKAFALKSLDRLLGTAWSPADGLAHVLAYEQGTADRIAGTLDDYAFTATAALDAYEATQEPRYLAAAQGIATAMLERFHDPAGGAFFDIEHQPGELPLVAARRKPLQDSPTPSGNAVAADVLVRLGNFTVARETLETFAGVAEHFGLYAASYGLALRRFLAA